MSVAGTIFPGEVSSNFGETIQHLAALYDPKEKDQLAVVLRGKEALFRRYFTIRGSLTLEATKALVVYKKTHKASWRDRLEVDTFSSLELPDKIQQFLGSEESKAGWIISQWMPRDKVLKPHQIPIYVEKKEGRVFCVIFDTRMNWEGIRKDLLKGFSHSSKKVVFYLSTQKRQHDWSTCSHLSLDDIKKVDRSDRIELYRFFEETYTSKEIERDGKWELVVSPRLPPQFMSLVQSMDDFKEYTQWAKDKYPLFLSDLDGVIAKITQKNGGEFPEELNNRIRERHKKNLKILLERIQQHNGSESVFLET